MNVTHTPRFAARLNALRIGADAYWPSKNKVTTTDLLTRAATAVFRERHAFKNGETIHLQPDAEHLHCFDVGSGQRMI